MAVTRPWRAAHGVDGPHRASLDDLAELNQVFSDAFTERYRRDGMVGVRVPFLNPAVWRYAIEDAADGAMLWRDERGQIVAFNMVHRSGAEGWMGPLAVRTEHQGAGTGKEIVTRGVEWLEEQGARVIGLETMPRTMDNIGFYSRIGFVPGRLTLTTTLEAAYAGRPAVLLGRRSAHEKETAMAACRELLQRQALGYDYTREIALTDELSLGDTVLLPESAGGDRLAGFALAHTVPLVEGRAREELRVLKLVLAREELFEDMTSALCDFARRSGTRRVALRVQGEYGATYQRLIGMGARVRWTDLRMALAGREERRPAEGVVLSNWEI
ncbi:MAG TPA: GNAT family N-acetyltransferase [Gemmatimonadaceae bacterium]|nr:GNAT family N-acetyltransferase [Gemmatimonadaceae bacterium]